MPASTTNCRLPLGYIILSCALLLLAACVPVPPPSQPMPTPPPDEIALDFETLAYRDWGGTDSYRGTEPAAVMVTSADQIAKRLHNRVAEQDRRLLQELDYDRYFAVVVFRGYFGSGCCGVGIRRMGMQGNRVVVYAEFSEKVPTQPQTAMAISPYHLVKVERTGALSADQDPLLVTWTV